MGILLAALLTSALGAGEAPPDPAAPPTGTLTRPPELLQFVPAEYPPEAAAAGIEGTVVLSIVIDAHGDVAQAVVTDPGPHPAFAAAALHAVQQFRFRPAEIDGKPAAVEIEYRYQFVLKRPEPPPPKVEAPVVLSGRVVERGTRSPVAGATVEAEGATAETGADGRFTLRGAPGEAVVRVSTPEHEPFARKETLQEGHPREVEYRLTRRRYDPYEAVVRGEQRPRDVTVRTLETEEVRTVPGTQGDVLKVLQDLPGVARAPFGIGLLVVRGAEPTQTPVYVDGILVPQLFHFLALTSVVNGDVVRSIDFYPGNFGVRWGRATGGTVELDTREPRRAWHGAAQVDVWDGRLEVEGPVGSGSAYASIRRSWIDAVLAVALPRVAPRSANDLRVAPRYYDYQTKLAFPLLGGQGSVFAFGSDDLLTFVRPQDQPGRPSFHLSTVFHRVGASWRRPAGALTNDLVLAVGRDTTDVNRGDAFGVASTMTSFTLRDAVAWRLSGALTLELGTDLYLRRLGYDVYASPPGTPGAISDPTQDSPSTVAESELGWWLSPAAYAEASWRATARLRLVGGLRADGERRFARSRAWLDPRLAAFYDLRPGTTLTAGAGLFGAPSQPQQTSPTFGNPALRPERALHLSLGVKQELPLRTSLEVTGYWKWMWDLVVRSADVDAATQQPLRYSNAGRGRAWGSELLLRRELASGLFGWVSWSWSRSERINDPSVTPYGWRLFLLDQTHVLAVVASYRLPREWIVGARVRFVSGNPYTPFAGAVLNADTGSFVCLPGAPLSRRFPPFFQADARVDKRWVYDRWMFSAYVDVQNVTNRQNEEARFRNYDCTDTVPVPSIPLFPAIGLRAEW